MSNFTKFLVPFVLLFFVFAAQAQTTYYSQGVNQSPSVFGSWNTATDGSGVSPTGFNLDIGDVYFIQNNNSMVTNGNWTPIGITLRIDTSASLTVVNTDNVIISTGGNPGILVLSGSYIHNSTAAIDNSILGSISNTYEIGSTFTIGSNQSFIRIIECANLTLSSGIGVTTTRSIRLDGTLNLQTGSTVTMNGTNSNINNLGSFTGQTGTGTINTKSTATTPIPRSFTWAGTVNYNNTTASQNIVAGDYTNLNGTGNNRQLSNGTIKIANTFTPGAGIYTFSGIPPITSTIEYNGTTSQNVASFTYNNLTISNTASVVNATGAVTVNNILDINNNAILNMATNSIVGSTLTTNGNGIIRTQSLSATPLPSGRTWSPAVEFNAATGGQTIVAGTYANLMNSNTSGTNTAAGTISVSNNLTLNTNSDLDMGTNALSNVGAALGLGSLKTQNTSTLPIPQNKTWPGTIFYNSTSAQTIVIGAYNNLNASTGTRILDNTNGTDINILGVFTPGTFTYTTTGSFINFNGAGSQVIPIINPSYDGLKVSNTGTKSLSGDVVATGTLILSNASDFLAINGHILTLQGSATMLGALKGSSTSTLVINGTAGGSPTIKFNAAASDSLINTITLNRTGSGAGLTLGSNVGITKLLLVKNGILDLTGRIVTLKSTSLTNTALVGPVSGTITHGGTGSFTVERFIPTVNRAFRDIAPSVNPNSNTFIFDSWQEGGATPVGLGTHITGLASATGGIDATTGLDKTQTGAVSLYSYVNGTFSSITNTKTTRANVYQGYRILIRGDRNVNLYQSPTPSTMNVATALRTNGQLVTGTVTYTTSGITNTNLNSTYSLNTSNLASDYSLIANPYACLLDWNKIVTANRNINLDSTYTVFNGSINTAGAYATYDARTNTSLPSITYINQYIQPGQSFFIQNSRPNPQLQILETDKDTGTFFSQAFRTTSTVNKLLINLYKQLPLTGMSNVDGCAVAFIPTDNNGVDGTDVEKFTNTNENLSVYRANKKICIERRNSAAVTDTIPLRLSQVSNNGVYSLCIDTKEFVSSNRAYIIDQYLHTEKLAKLNDTTKIDFSVSIADTTSFINRFFIVFRSNGTLPLNNIVLKAFSKNNGVQVDWNTTNEIQLDKFEIEKSTNGTNFNKIGTEIAKNGLVNNYGVYDAVPIKGANYYRIKIINQNNSSQYSKVVLLNLGDVTNQVTIYPNPVKGTSLSLQLNNLSNGNYQVEMFNSNGQKVHAQQFLYSGNSSTQIIDWMGKKLASGNYIVSITSASGIKTNRSIFIEE